MELLRPDGSPVRVLVVDDETNIAELIGMALRYEGWEVRLAHTGAEAVSAAKEFSPDAVVLDIAHADGSRTRTPDSGVGLGLALVEAIANAHGGSVSLASVPGDTTVTVHLPAERAEVGACSAGTWRLLGVGGLTLA